MDEGGVTKEFFQLLTRELFNVSYGEYPDSFVLKLLNCFSV